METSEKQELVVLNHMSVADYKAAHNNNQLRIFHSADKNGVMHTFFTCGSTRGAISKNVKLPISPSDRVQIITVQGDEGPLDILCREAGFEPMQVL